MTPSTTKTFTLNRNQICTNALRKVGASAVWQTPNPQDIAYAVQELNSMIKNWRGDNIFVFDIERSVYSFTASSFVAGTDGNVYECTYPHTSALGNKPVTGAKYKGFWKLKYNVWVTATSYVAGDIVVGTDNNIYECILAHVAGASTRPITGGSWATYWVLDSSVTVTTWAVSTSYSSICAIQLNADTVGIGDGFIREDDLDTPIDTELSSGDYFGLGNKIDNPGTPTECYFKRGHTNYMFFYPYPDSTTDYVVVVEEYRQPSDFTDAANTPDFMQEWVAALVDGLAVRLHSTFPHGSSYAELVDQSIKSLMSAKGLDSDKGDIYFRP